MTTEPGGVVIPTYVYYLLLSIFYLIDITAKLCIIIYTAHTLGFINPKRIKEDVIGETAGTWDNMGTLIENGAEVLGKINKVISNPAAAKKPTRTPKKVTSEEGKE